jgi:plasmid stabilization system protein ParE
MRLPYSLHCWRQQNDWGRFPRLGRVVPEFEAEGFRELIFENYRIVYAIEADTVTIYSVLHTSIDVSNRLRDMRKKP